MAKVELSSTLHMSFEVRSDRPSMWLGSRPYSRLSRCLVAHGEIAKTSGRAEAVQNPPAKPLIY